MNRCFAVLAAAALSACSSYGPGSLSKDASVESTLQAMGPPTADVTLPNGERRLEYARGPYGKHTYMVDFDAQGHLLRWDQVLTESRFNAIQAGMTANDVLAQIGHASETYYIGWQKQNVWAYRYESPFCVWFQVGLDQQGKVVDTAYGPDPICEHPRDAP